MIVGPDAARYLHLAGGNPAPRPFCWRWLVPALCGTDKMAWRRCRVLSQAALAAAMFWFAQQRLDCVGAVVAALVVVSLPGIIGPKVANPVGVDLPATALAVCSAAFATGSNRWVAAAVLCAVAAGSARETAPLFAALWAWSPWPLVGLAAPAVRFVWVRWRHLEGPDPLGEEFQQIADHPLRAGLGARRGRWRDWRLMALPWGACLAALYAPTWQVVAVLAVAHLQLLVATDTVRLVHHGAAPAVAVAAVAHLPHRWLLPAAVAHLFVTSRAERV